MFLLRSFRLTLVIVVLILACNGFKLTVEKSAFARRFPRWLSGSSWKPLPSVLSSGIHIYPSDLQIIGIILCLFSIDIAWLNLFDEAFMNVGPHKSFIHPAEEAGKFYPETNIIDTVQCIFILILPSMISYYKSLFPLIIFMFSIVFLSP